MRGNVVPQTPPTATVSMRPSSSRLYVTAFIHRFPNYQLKFSNSCVEKHRTRKLELNKAGTLQVIISEDHTDHHDFSSHSEDPRKSEQTFQGGYTRWWNSAGNTGSYPRQTVYHYPAHSSPYGGGNGTQEDSTNYRRHDVRYINRYRTTKTMRSRFGDKLKHVSGRRISPRLHAVLRKGRFNKDGGFKRRVLITAARGAVAQTAVSYNSILIVIIHFIYVAYF
ncbi:uncharacterized protein V6R79_008496 [Siganus canaliculatus]